MRILFFITIIAAMMSCKNQKDAAADMASNETVAQDTLVVVIEKPVQPKDSLIISFEKTPCFGRCPVYKIKVFESGFAIYEGINFAEKMGTYSTRSEERRVGKE